MLFSEEDKTIWLWKGIKAKIRSKFIGAKKSQELRGQVGLSNKVVSIDEGDEPDDFLRAVGAPPRAGNIVAKEIKAEEPMYSQEPPAFSSNYNQPEPAPKPVARAQPVAQPMVQPVYQQPAPVSQPPAPAPAPRAVAAPAPVAAAPAVSADVNADRVLGILSNLKIPEGYQREMVIIGNSAYSVAIKEQMFLGKKKVERMLEPIGSLPEGVFFADGYAPRVLVESGVVLAIEFLKKEASEYSEKAEVEHTTLKESIKDQDAKGLVSSLGFKVRKS